MRTVIIVMAVIFSAAALFVTALTATLPTERSAGSLILAPEDAPTASPAPLKPAANSSLRQTAGKTEYLPVPQPAGSIYGESEDSDSEEAVQRLKEEQETYQTLVSDLQQDIAALESELERRDQGSEIEHIREKQTASGEEMRQLREELALLQQVVEHRGVKEKVTVAPVATPSETPDPVEGQRSREAPLIPDKQHPPPRFTVVSGSEEGGRVIAILGGGAFPSGQETPSEDLLQAIRNLLPEIVINADSMIIVEGHADSMPTRSGQEGSLADNKTLSLQRAESVALLLEVEGVDPSRISIAGLGATRPLAPNTTADGRAENRRVEIRLIPASSESGAVQKRQD
jgi:flagellar motor protein MotB